MRSIGDWVFANCWFTGSLTIPDSVETIGECTFWHCPYFPETLILGSSLKSIGAGAFEGCNYINNGIKEVTSLNLPPPDCLYTSTYDYIFTEDVYSKPLSVSKESIDLYKTAPEWKKFLDIRQIPVEATGITLDKSEVNLLIGQSETLTATLTPEDSTDEVVWSLDESGKNIVSVDTDGKVTGLTVGSAIITATAGNVSATPRTSASPSSRQRPPTSQ